MCEHDVGGGVEGWDCYILGVLRESWFRYIGGLGLLRMVVLRGSY